MADWSRIAPQMRRAREAIVESGRVAANDQIAARLRDTFDDYGLCLADREVLFIAIVAMAVMGSTQEHTPMSPFAVSARLLAALASLVPAEALPS